MLNRVFWSVAALLTIVFGIALFANHLNSWVDAVICVAYYLATGLTFKFLYNKRVPREP